MHGQDAAYDRLSRPKPFRDCRLAPAFLPHTIHLFNCDRFECPEFIAPAPPFDSASLEHVANGGEIYAVGFPQSSERFPVLIELADFPLGCVAKASVRMASFASSLKGHGIDPTGFERSIEDGLGDASFSRDCSASFPIDVFLDSLVNQCRISSWHLIIPLTSGEIIKFTIYPLRGSRKRAKVTSKLPALN